VKIFSGIQIRNWDAATISEQHLESYQLMERAATQAFNWIHNHLPHHLGFNVFCGKGNNGGDGLVIARKLIHAGREVHVYVLETGLEGSADFRINLQRLHEITTHITFCQNPESFPIIKPDTIVIDSLFGTGLNKPLQGLALSLITHLKSFPAIRIAIDIPSGMFTDQPTEKDKALSVMHTLSFQSPKLAFMFDENREITGQVHLLDIGLSQRYNETTSSMYETIEDETIRMIIQPRKSAGNKGTFGHAALIAGSTEMMGAAILSARGCLASGVGKTTLITPYGGFSAIHTSTPEVLCVSSGENKFEKIIPLIPYQSVGIGPGIGTSEQTRKALIDLFTQRKDHLVLDADALNNLTDQELLKFGITHSVITPHPREFDRLFGVHQNSFERISTSLKVSSQSGIFIILKGHHTAIITPAGRVYFNTTGNDGMAKGGSGDVLTGLITGLMAQGYPLPEAAIAAVYLHGLAGNLAAKRYSRHAMQPSHIIRCLHEVWKEYE